MKVMEHLLDRDEDGFRMAHHDSATPLLRGAHAIAAANQEQCDDCSYTADLLDEYFETMFKAEAVYNKKAGNHPQEKITLAALRERLRIGQAVIVYSDEPIGRTHYCIVAESSATPPGGKLKAVKGGKVA